MNITTYNPLDNKYLTVATILDNGGQRSIRLILNITDNEFYTLDDDGNFRSLGYEKAYINYFSFGSTGTTVVTSTTEYFVASGSTEPTVGLFNDGLKFYPQTSRVVNEGGGTITVGLNGIITVGSQNNNQIHAAFFKNGELISSSEQQDIVGSGGRAAPIPIQTITTLNNGDYIDLRVKNSTGINNIILYNLNVIIREV